MTMLLDEPIGYGWDSDVHPAHPNATFVRSGAITAFLLDDAQGRRLIGPLVFDGQPVCETGTWPIDAGTSVDDALYTVYTAEFDGWCARLHAERAAERAANPIPARRSFRLGGSGMHTPCPALWAGR